MWSFSTDFRKISQYQIPRKNPPTGRRRWQMRTNGRTDMQLMGVLRERARNSPKTCTVNCRNVTYVRIKYISDNGQCPIQYRYRKRKDQVPYAWFLVFIFSKALRRTNIKCVLYTFPYRIIPNTLHCNKISGELRSSYGRHVRRKFFFLLNCPLQLPGFSENLNVSIHFSTAPNTKFQEYSFSSLEVLHADGDIQTWRTQHAHFNQFWFRMSQKKISEVSNRVSQRPCHKPVSYPTKTPGRQNSKATGMSVPFKPFLVSKCLRQLKASAAIKDCLLYEGVNLLLASYSEGGGGYLWINASVALNRPARHLAHHLCSSDIIKANTQHLLQYVCHTFKQPRFTTAADVSHNDWWALL